MPGIKVVLDLDGPLLEGRDRQWACYRQVLGQLGHDALPLEEYWQIKRSGADRRALLAASGAEAVCDEFLEGWLELIETPEFLKLDRLQPGVLDVLDRWLAAGTGLVLATHRRDHVALRDQLHRLGLEQRLDHVLPSPPTGGAAGKASAVQNALGARVDEVQAWVGDTPLDHAAARILGCEAWIVTSGVRNARVFEGLDCEWVVDGLASLPVPGPRPPGS